MTTEALNEVLIQGYLKSALDSAIEGDQEEACHWIRCVLLRAGLEQTEAYRALTTREVSLAYERRQSASLTNERRNHAQ